MSRLRVSVAWLAALPAGLLVHEEVSGYASRTDTRDGGVWLLGIPEPRRAASVGALALDLSDTLTAAAVAARIVRPWLMEQGSRSGREFGDVEALAEHHGSLSAALLMEPLTPDQRDELTRLARAAMEGA